MPLILSMREGQDFYVKADGRADERVELSMVFTARHFILTTDDGSEHEITDVKGTEVLPDVVISAGSGAHAGLARLAISAPRTIDIIRGKTYREGAQ